MTEIPDGGSDLSRRFNCAMAHAESSFLSGLGRSSVHTLSSGPGLFPESERYFNPCKRNWTVLCADEDCMSPYVGSLLSRRVGGCMSSAATMRNGKMACSTGSIHKNGLRAFVIEEIEDNDRAKRLPKLYVG
jgi:hypothetical protein